MCRACLRLNAAAVGATASLFTVGQQKVEHEDRHRGATAARPPRAVTPIVAAAFLLRRASERGPARGSMPRPLPPTSVFMTDIAEGARPA
ncbi:hypothetical protein NDU88_006722 [Pleurodeles waltl]|uniref:Secreted protein n=1 Tax=Pleurodeles waltl TaxID=8319 RepID=A0AAV7X2D6_PLEWA|nr:hypothetical protein NDU88_006722 [Pleurodeles waltl]